MILEYDQVLSWVCRCDSKLEQIDHVGERARKSDVRLIEQVLG